jgi:uncharacterized protein YbbC (DUF1343 family)
MRYFLLCFLLCQSLSALGFSSVALADDAGSIVGQRLQVGAERAELYLQGLKGKRLALVVNQTSRVGEQHLVDYLQQARLDIRRIFAPEHGFRGTDDAGATVEDGIDARSGVPVASLYGQQKKPSAEQLADVDVILFDIQDVGVRYYTYISTLHYVMEAAAEHHKPLLVLDRPNPNGDYVDGPVLEKEHASFVGMHPIPLVHGLTVGELARMIKGEGWIAGAEQLDLKIIPVAPYNHITRYVPPIPPSPNLPNLQAIRLYPSLGLFEGTGVSVARGTVFPFQALGLPLPQAGLFKFVPQAMPGAQFPPYRGETCYGMDLRKVTPPPYLNLDYLRHFYQAYAAAYPEAPEGFFNAFFTRLAGTTKLQQSIMAGESNAEIRQGWQAAIADYRQLRKQYMLYR